MDVSWEEAKSVPGDRKEWRSLVVFQQEQEDLSTQHFPGLFGTY